MEVSILAGFFKRSKKYYAMYCVGGKRHKVNFKTDSKQIAKALLRQIETKLGNPLPTKTPLGEILNAYVEFIETIKTPRASRWKCISAIYQLLENV